MVIDLTSPFRDDCLKGKVGLVTGGGTGLGFEIARQLGKHGGRVAIMGRRVPVLQAAQQSLEAEGIECLVTHGDVRKIEDCRAAVHETVQRFGRLDLLVNNAAGNFLAPVDALSPNAFKTVVDIDAGGVFNCTSAAIPHLRSAYAEHGDASLVNISASYELPPFYQAHAAAAKMAVNSLTRSFALEFADYGIRSNGISPGPVPATGASKLGGGGKRNRPPIPFPETEGLPRGLKAGTPWDVAMMVVYLTSAAGGWVSGDTLVVDGGFQLRRGLPIRDDGFPDVDREGIVAWARDREVDDKKNPKFVAGESKL